MKLLVVILFLVGGITAARGQNVGGEVMTIIEQVPYIVSIQNFGIYLCAGAIISENKILTAAQCTYPYPAFVFQVRAGSTQVEQGGQLIQVASIVNHPGYNPLSLNNDISIVRLATNLIFSPTTTSIGMPTQGAQPVAGTMALLSFWFGTIDGGSSLPLLRSVRYPIITNDRCKVLLGSSIAAGIICVDKPEGQRACTGDTGSPLVAGNLLVALDSWSSRCFTPNEVGIYTHVAQYTNWINVN